jgi:hypothetical protein
MFRFGFWRGGVCWGWPSSHTTIAFAMAAIQSPEVENGRPIWEEAKALVEKEGEFAVLIDWKLKTPWRKARANGR